MAKEPWCWSINLKAGRSVRSAQGAYYSNSYQSCHPSRPVHHESFSRFLTKKCSLRLAALCYYRAESIERLVNETIGRWNDWCLLRPGGAPAAVAVHVGISTTINNTIHTITTITTIKTRYSSRPLRADRCKNVTLPASRWWREVRRWLLEA